ncbi:hypothetical protein BGZ99_004558 [Dissophora globulifera]|uniref:Uncharacterized protein n=1 Tax=Dissophora globulifera TaxID=979702 RepID=A0A9P6UUZ1_9FUNG|nr:hypothetical protein BGZ99_004558 [Dissophora globulifera]
MTSTHLHPLDIPEIIALVGQFIPLWSFSKDVYTRTSLIRDVFEPQDLLSAALVNRAFHHTLTPLLWQVYDDSLVYDSDNDKSRDSYLAKLRSGSRHICIPSNILFSHCHHFRIFYNTFRALFKIRFPPPRQYTWFTETCTDLRELTLSRWVKDRFAWQIIAKNPALRLLSWESSGKFWPAMRQRDYDALSVLHKLESLHLSWFTIDLARLCEAVLRRNATSLKELSFRDVAGFDSEAAWGPILGRSHSDQENKGNQGGDHQRDGGENAMTVSARPGILLSNLKTLRLDCAWDETISIESLISEGLNDEGFGYSSDEDERDSADELYDDTDEDDPHRTDIRIDNTALPGLFRCCPALEILFWQPREEIDMNRISQSLREYCPRFDTIRRIDSFLYFRNELTSNEDDCVLLIQGCTPPLSLLSATSSLSIDDDDVSSEPKRDVRGQGLKYFEVGLSFLNAAITSALLVHASSLQDIKLDLCDDNKINFENAGRLLQYCPGLKRFSIQVTMVRSAPQDGLLLFQHEWGCQQLESLHLLGIAEPREYSHFFANYQDDQDEQEVQEQAQPEEQGQGHDLEQSQEQIEAFEHSQLLVSSKTTGTAASNTKYIAFTPAHWRAVSKPSINGRYRLKSPVGTVFRRALFERADTMPNLVDLILNGIPYKRDNSN